MEVRGVEVRVWRQGGCRGKGRTFFISAASRSEIRIGFESLNSMPLISEMPTAPFAKAPCTG